MAQLNKTIFQKLLDQVDTAIGLLETTSGNVLLLNKAGRKLLGVEPPFSFARFCKETLQQKKEYVHRVLSDVQQGKSVRKDIYLNTHGEKGMWLEMQAEHLLGTHEQYVLLTFLNLSQGVDTETKLLKEIQKFEALFNYASMGILVADAKGEIILANPFVHQQFGYERNEIVGNKVELLIPTRYREKHQGYRGKFMEQPQARSMGLGLELFGLKKDGTEFPVQVSLGHFRNEEGSFVIAFIVDDTLRKEHEAEILRQKVEMQRVNEEIKKLNDLLEQKVSERTQMLQTTLKELERSRDELSKALEKEKQLNDMKSRFVSMASHEFRTPLSTILSSTSLLAKYTTTEEQPKREKHIDRIKSSVNTLTDILNEFLSLGKIEDGKIEPKWQQFSLPELIASVSRQLDPIKKQGQIIQHDHYGIAKVVLDPGLIKNILINLINNAIKFSPERSLISIVSEADHKNVIIRVKDQGIGISEEDQQHLFERFFRGANVTNIQGTGLGLHIVSRYVQLMNGAISCKSKLEEGTEFTIQFKQHQHENYLTN